MVFTLQHGIRVQLNITHSLWELAEVSRILLVLVIDHMPVGLVGFDTLQRQKVMREVRGRFNRSKLRRVLTEMVQTWTASGF